MDTKIVIFSFNRIHQKDYQKYSIDKLSEYFDVEIWDVGPWLNNAFHEKEKKINPMPGDIVFTRSIYSKAEFISLLALNGRSYFLSFLSYSYLVKKVYDALCSIGIKYIVYLGVCYPACSYKPRLSFYSKVKRFVKVFGFFQLFDRLVSVFLFREGKFYPDAIILSGDKSKEIYQFSKHSKRIFWGHTWNYQRFLAESHKNHGIIGSEGRYALFIDQYVPFHPDNVIENVEINAKVYYSNLNKFFSFFEEKTGLPVVISSHPRSSYSEDDISHYFYGRKVSYNDSYWLCENAEIVISHGSGALDFAILFNKPVLLVTMSEIINTAWGMYAVAYAQALEQEIISIGDSKDYCNLNLCFEVDKAKYQHFLSNYIKSSMSENESIDILLMKIFKDVYENK